VRDFYCGKDFKGDPPLSKKVLAGLTTGAFGIAIANPTDVIKIRFQVDGNKPPNERRYTNVRDAYRKIYLTEGLRGFWRAVLPNMVRNSVINSAELATFD
jgi:solute carrier family 25 uncoupling protein 8/9